jgi:transcriptional regulator with XRE-family HTH domain
MDNALLGFDHARVSQPPKKRARKQPVPVYLAEWLDFLEVAPVELVKAEVISEGYLSLLRNGKRVNPSPGKLMQIGTFLKIQWTDLYRRPPTAEAMSAIESLGVDTVERIRRRGR